MNDVPLASFIIALVQSSLACFFESYCWIKQKGGAFVEGLPMHEYQRKIEEVQAWCKANNVPCRIVGLKPRRGGSSTFAVASMYHFLIWTAGKLGCVMGGSDYQGSNLWAMLRTMAGQDRTVPKRATIMDKAARFPNGSTAVRINASNENAGLSGGYDFMVITELAKWQDDGVAAAPEVLAGALKCVPFLPGTTIIIESTAEGVGDEFHRIYSTGITFEELKAGKVGYVKIFSPWFEFKDHILAPETMGIESFEYLTKDEQELVDQYKLSLPQVAWMRYTIKDQCKGDFDNFKENYPFNDVECFLMSGRKVFNSKGIEAMKADAYKFPWATGNLDFIKGSKDTSIVWRSATAETCRVLRCEQPIEGCRYLISIDPMTGASNVSSEDPDNHAVKVWRAPYRAGDGTHYPARIVAFLVDDWSRWLQHKEYRLIWDIDVLEEQVYRLAQYFGNCMIVPEMNMERGMVRGLVTRGCNIYVRQAFNKREQTEMNILGFSTTGGESGTREMVISELARGIREYGRHDPHRGWSEDRCEIYDPITLAECETFVVKLNGRSEAMQGHKDDNVLSAAIGLACIESASTYRRPVGQRVTRQDDDERPESTSGYA